MLTKQLKYGILSYHQSKAPRAISMENHKPQDKTESKHKFIT